MLSFGVGSLHVVPGEAAPQEQVAEIPVPMHGRWTGCGRAVAAEISWERWRSEIEGQDPVDGLWTGWRCRNSMGGG